jgi:hypothetical protein
LKLLQHQLLLLLLTPLLLTLRSLLRLLLTLLLLRRPLPRLLRWLLRLHRLLHRLQTSNSGVSKSRPAGRLFYAWTFGEDVKKPASCRFFVA